MRTDLQLIQSALADYSPLPINRDYNKNHDYFNFYSLELSEKYKGLPSTWYFAVLSDQDGPIDEATKRKIITSASNLVTDALASPQELPLVMIWDVPNLYLNAEIGFNKEPVFFLEGNNLPGKSFTAKDIHAIPLIVAVRNKFTRFQVPFAFSPYTPMLPARDWRFFGRKKEITEIVSSLENYFIVGGRKIGKTSLLIEIETLLKKAGFKVYWIKVQSLDTIDAVIREIALNLSAQEVHKAQKASKILGVDYLTSIIKKLKTDKKKMVLILDEIGNVLTKDTRYLWNFMGTLRDMSHKGEFRIIASAFQEIIMKQYEQPDGPFVNFGHTLKLEVFTKHEVDELITHPLSLWSEVQDKNKLNRLIREKFGAHPLILQFLGRYLFQRTFQQNAKKVEELVEELLIPENLVLFEEAINEIFVRDVPYLERYVFLKICYDGINNGKELNSIQITHRDITPLLKEIKAEQNLDERNFFLEKLSLRGWIYRDPEMRSIFRIASPIIYTYYKTFDSIPQMCIDLLDEICKSEPS